MSESFHLYQLQKVDRQIDQIKQRLAEISSLLTADEAVRQAQKHSEDSQTALKAARQALKRIEDSVQTKQIKKEQSESMLYGGKVRNPKELQDLQSEVASLKRSISTLEDQQIEAMIQLEEAEKANHFAEQELAKAQARFAEQNANLTGEQNQLLHREERLQVERSAITSQISPETLKAYERLRQQKRGTAVASVDEGTCEMCGASLTPAEQQAARSPHQMVYCPSCGRILYSG